MLLDGPVPSAMRRMGLPFGPGYPTFDGMRPKETVAGPVVILILIAFAAMGATDLYLDAPDSWLSAHVLLELSLVSLSLGAAIYLALGWRRTADDLEDTRAALMTQHAAAAAWQAKAEVSLLGLSHAIDEQFTVWMLTPAEREVAVLILKGLGHKQIAAATGRSERTVRQHAVEVYTKSGLNGRAELAAFFLEGLRLPMP